MDDREVRLAALDIAYKTASLPSYANPPTVDDLVKDAALIEQYIQGGRPPDAK